MSARLVLAVTVVTLIGFPALAQAGGSAETVLFLRGAAYPESVLSTEPPDAERVGNLDRGRNDDPGLTLESGGSGRREFDDARFQDFLFPADGLSATGPVTLVLWVATPEPDSTAVIRARIHDCNEYGFGCADVAVGESAIDFSGATGFVPLEIPIPLDGHVWAADRTLELRLLAETSSGGPIWVGYDALEASSALRIGQLTTTTTTQPTTTTMPPVTTTTAQPPPPVHPSTTVTTSAVTSTTTTTTAAVVPTTSSTTSTTEAPPERRLDSLIFDLSPPEDDETPGSPLRAAGPVLTTLSASLISLWPWLVAMGVLTAIAVRTARASREPST